MKKILLAISLAPLFFLTACAVHTPSGSVVIDPEGHYYDGDYHDHRGNGKFCPPGQAKKGRC